MGCPGPHSAAGLQPTAHMSTQPMPQDPSAWHSCSTNQADGKAPLPPTIASPARSRHASMSCPMGSGLWFPEAQVTAETHMPQARRGLLTARPPRGRCGEAGIAWPQHGWTLPRDGQRGGQGAGRGLGPRAAPVPSPSRALSQGPKSPTLQQSSGEETHSPTPHVLRGHPNPSALGSPPAQPQSSLCQSTLGPTATLGTAASESNICLLPCATHCLPWHRAPSHPGTSCHRSRPGTVQRPVLPRATATPRRDTQPLAHPAEAKGVGLVPGHSVVADQRVGKHQDLCLVGGVGEGLGVPHHASLEHCRGSGWG